MEGTSSNSPSVWDLLLVLFCAKISFVIISEFSLVFRIYDIININISRQRYPMYCRACGNQMEEGQNRCPKCGTSKVDIKQQLLKKTKEENANANIIIMIFVFCFLLGTFIADLRILCIVAALITIVTGKMKYPDDKRITVLFIASIAIIILMTLYFLILLVTCYAALSSCGSCLTGMQHCG